jgi:hypothetical protein
VGVAAFASIVGFDRSRGFYPTILIVVGSYYVLFAAMNGSAGVLWAEIGFGSVFLLAATVGFRKSMWLVAAMMAGHGVFDFVHHLVVVNPGVPRWWPGFCGSFDVVAGVWMAVLLRMRSEPPRLS